MVWSHHRQGPIFIFYPLGNPKLNLEDAHTLRQCSATALRPQSAAALLIAFRNSPIETAMAI
jgi:hypothetical protein